MPSEFLPSFPLVPEVSPAAGSADLLSSVPPAGSPPSDPIPTTARADTASALTVDVTTPPPKAPATVEDRVSDSATASAPVSHGHRQGSPVAASLDGSLVLQAESSGRRPLSPSLWT